MPFVNKEHRKNPDKTIPGDRCYQAYSWLMNRWKEKPSWTGFDNALTVLFPDIKDQQRANILALLVFFNIHIMPYEQKKRKENGDI